MPRVSHFPTQNAPATDALWKYTVNSVSILSNLQPRLPTSRGALKPLLPFKEEIGKHRGKQHQHDRERIAVGPFEFRDRLEIHAIDRGDERRRHEHDCGDGKDLDDVVLLQTDDAEHG